MLTTTETWVVNISTYASPVLQITKFKTITFPSCVTSVWAWSLGCFWEA